MSNAELEMIAEIREMMKRERLNKIAAEELEIQELMTAEEFPEIFEVNTEALKRALNAAYQAGRQAGA